MIEIIILISVLVAIFGALIVLFFKFKKYEGKLKAEILKKDGGTERKDITDAEENTFDHDGKSYNIKQSAIFQDHPILPRRTIKYIEGIPNPIQMEEKDGKKRIKKDYIDSIELNYILGIKFDGLFSNEEKTLSLPFDKKYLVLIGIAIVVVIMLVIFLPSILEQVGVKEATEGARQGAEQTLRENLRGR